MRVEPTSTLTIKETDDHLTVILTDKNDNIIDRVEVNPSVDRIKQKKQCDELFKDVTFAEPIALVNHPVVNS